jgi:ParB family chromosome partitioning protein
MDITKVIDVPMQDIKLQGSNVRSDLDSPNSQENIIELAENIKINGLLQPIVFRGEYGKPPYDVIVGQRRYLAHKYLEAENIKATFSGEIDDTNALLLSLSENMCRQEMNHEDISNAITKLYKYFENDEYKVQQHTGFSIRMIRSYVKIDAHATEKIKTLIRENKISLSDARRAIDAAQGDNDKADFLIDELVNLSKYEKKRLVESGMKNPKAKGEDLLAEAKQPKLEETIILNLPRKVHRALIEASEKLAIDIEELTINTLINWLKTNDFLIET